MEGTFSSRKKTESLLRPEFENGNVAYHDMELAQASDISLLTQPADKLNPHILYSLSSQARTAICQ